MLGLVDAIMATVLLLSMVTTNATESYYKKKGKNLPPGKLILKSKIQKTTAIGCFFATHLLFWLIAPILLLFGYFDQILGWSTFSSLLAPLNVTLVLQVSGIALYIVGDAMCLAGRLSLKERYADLWATTKLGSDFKRTGIYSRIRHPIYSGTIIYMAALVIFFQTWLGLAILIPILAIMVRTASKEEKFLKEKFGSEYETYMRRTGRFLPKRVSS